MTYNMISRFDTQAGRTHQRTIAAAVAMVIGLLAYLPSDRASAVDPSRQHALSRIAWPKILPAPDTIVDVQTRFGLFRLPIGYLAHPDWISEKQHQTTADGRDLYVMSELSFKFAMPTGETSNTQVTWFDVDDASGHPDPNKYMVFFLREVRYIQGQSEPPDLPNGVLVEQPQQMLGSLPVQSYKGRTEVPDSHNNVGVTLYLCDEINCAAHFYFEQQGLMFWALLPSNRHNEAFSIAAKASVLLARWRVGD